MQTKSADEMFEYTSDSGGGGGGSAPVVNGARALVPPDNNRNSKPYRDDYPPTTPHTATNIDNYYYAPVNDNVYNQEDADFYSNVNPVTGGYYPYADNNHIGSEAYQDQEFYTAGYSDNTAIGMTGAIHNSGTVDMTAGTYDSDKLTDSGSKTFMTGGENNGSPHIVSKPDTREV
ncbi:hypothetical protein BD408DRAFT_202187 [Parasitella parasitica]|nr:hypothetical protein BD408DRAFT_202187 [Parasitella parasitica]